MLRRWVIAAAWLAMCCAGCEPAAPPKVAPAAVPSAPAMPAAQSEPGPADADAETEFTTTGSGLKYKILRKGHSRKPVPTDVVVAHYRGWLAQEDGKEKEFDSSYKRGEPTPFRMNGVIKGWTEGLQLIGVGGMIELEVPSELGYGPDGFAPDIPPNATLHFLVELIQVQ
jgi:FKBP-type peptidyl-prolyl cis-trans isomerase FkpA